jgi:hypothetical protein
LSNCCGTVDDTQREVVEEFRLGHQSDGFRGGEAAGVFSATDIAASTRDSGESVGDGLVGGLDNFAHLAPQRYVGVLLKGAGVVDDHFALVVDGGSAVVVRARTVVVGIECLLVLLHDGRRLRSPTEAGG